MMSDETTAEQCVHVPQSTMALHKEAPIETSLSDDENGNTECFPVECSSAYETGNTIWETDMCTMS